MTRRLSTIEQEVREIVETLRALYFLAQSLSANDERLSGLIEVFPQLSRADRLRLRDEFREELRWLKAETGAFASDREYRGLYETIRAYPGYYYLDKLSIERQLFTHYSIVFPRWPYMKDHVAVIFDGQTNRRLNQIFELEGNILRDARMLLRKAIEAEGGVTDFRRRGDADQLEVLMFSRAALVAAMHFVEAYLNGIAYDCFHRFHDHLEITDHDLLAEWNSEKQRQRFVEFRVKVFRYPSICARMRGIALDLSGCKAAHALIEHGKEYRDALVHPSPFIDPNTGQNTKFWIQASIDSRLAALVLNDALAYAEFVERGLGNDPSLSAPWLSERSEPNQAPITKENAG